MRKAEANAERLTRLRKATARQALNAECRMKEGSRTKRSFEDNGVPKLEFGNEEGKM